MDYAYPPIPAGEKIITSETNAIIYPVYDDENHVKQWNFSIKNEASGSPEETIKLSDGEISIASEMSKISTPQSGKEKFVLFDEKQIYIIEEINSKIQLTKKIRADSFVGKNAFFTISPSSNSEVQAPTSAQVNDSPIINPTIRARSFYCGYSKNADSEDMILYDLLDDNFLARLPFKPSSKGELEVSFLSLITSYKTTYIVFVTTETDSNNRYSVSLYAIAEKDLIQKSKSLTDADFATNHLDLSDNYPLNIYIDHFYHDQQNSGSSQLVLYFNSTDGNTTLFKMFEIDKDSKIANVATYSKRDDDSHSKSYQYCMLGLTPMKQRKGQSSYVMSEHGPTFFHHDVLLSEEGLEPKKEKKMHANQSFFEIIMIVFNSEDKKFIELNRGGAWAGYTLHEHTSHAKPLPYEFVPEMPWLFNVYTVPKVIISKNKSSGLSIKLQGITVFFRVLKVKSSAFSSLENIVTTEDRPIFKSAFQPIDNDGAFPWLKNESLLDGSVADKAINDCGISIPAGIPISKVTANQNGLFLQKTADLKGESIILGTPNLSFTSKIAQITGFFRALPFQEQLKKSPPMINESSSESRVRGVAESTSSSWQVGYNAGASASAEGVALSAHFGKNFGGHDMTMKSDTSGISLHSMSDLSSYDLVKGYAADFYLWEYPVYRYSTSPQPFDFVTIFVPIGYSQQSLDAKENDLAYFQDYEIGSLLTYIGSDIPGYSEELSLFSPATMTVTSDSQGGMSLTYGNNNSTSKDKTTSSDTSMNAGFGLNLFGAMNLTGQGSKSESRNTSVHTTQTTDFSLSFHSGTVIDSQYEYKITPLVYRHEDSRAVVTTCRVELEGLAEGWKSYFSGYDVRLMKSFPATKNKELNAFSRSIRFEEQADHSVNISLHLFNNSLYFAQNIKCDLYLGKANFNSNPVDVSKLKLLGTLTVESMEVVGRQIITLEKQSLPKESFITVKITVNDLETSIKYFWGGYSNIYTAHVLNSILEHE